MSENKTMKNPFPVTFTDKGFINSKLLNQYDLDGQTYALQYFLRTQKWEINNNKIVFPELTNDELIQDLLNIHSTEYAITLIEQRLDQVSNCSIFGIESCRETLGNELKHHTNRKQKYERNLEEHKEITIENSQDTLEMEE